MRDQPQLVSTEKLLELSHLVETYSKISSEKENKGHLHRHRRMTHSLGRSSNAICGAGVFFPATLVPTIAVSLSAMSV